MVTPLESGDPARIGRYRTLGQLGAGGMGRVLLGIGPDGRLVAIKQIHAHLVTERDFLPRFRREVQASARVSGAFTAAVVDFDVDTEEPWLASVFVPGLPLDKAVELTGPMLPDQVRTLAVGLAAALRAVHETGLIHRDLKPANVILAADGPRVIDFGIARAEGHSELTHTGSLIGSPSYMSPEQAQSAPLTPASDVFSLGAVLAMAASGKSPFAGNSMPLTLFNIVHMDPDLTGLHPDLAGLIGPCLNKDPARRPTPAQILDFLGPLGATRYPWSPDVHAATDRQAAELAALIGGPGTAAVGVVAEQSDADRQRLADKLNQLAVEQDSRRPRSRRRLIAMVSSAAFLVTATGIGAWAFSSSDSASPRADPLAAVNLTELRSMNLCAVLHDPLGGPFGNWTTTFTRDHWGTCGASAGGVEVDLTVERIDSYRDIGKTAHGISVFEPTAPETGSCSSALKAGRTEPQFGFVVHVKGAGDHAVLCDKAADAARRIADRVAVARPLLPGARDSTISQDPCSLVDNDFAKMEIGPQVQGAPSDLHSCRWGGPNTVTLSIHRSPTAPQPPSGPTVSDSGPGGPTAVTEAEAFATSCAREMLAPHGDTANDYEVLTVVVENHADIPTAGARCSVAMDVLHDVSQNLPGGSQ